jgi:hypothetical protein
MYALRCLSASANVAAAGKHPIGWGDPLGTPVGAVRTLGSSECAR